MHIQGLLNQLATFLGVYTKKPGVILIYSLLLFGLSAVRVAAEDDILVIHSYGSELSSSKEFQENIEQGLAEIGNQSNVYHEFLDSFSHPQLGQSKEFVQYLSKKYRRISIDLVMVINQPSLKFILDQHQKFFPDIPVVFLGVESLNQKLIDTSWLTGVVEDYPTVETTLEAVRQNWSDTVIVISNETKAGQRNLERIESLKNIAPNSLKVELINDLMVDDIGVRLKKYPDNFPILVLGHVFQTSSREQIVDPRLDTSILQKRLANPIYTDSSTRLGTGVVGGKVLDIEYHTRQAVELAHKILQGASPDKLGPVERGKNRWIFDYRQLLKHRIKLDLLPKDSELLYVEPPIHVRYRTVIFLVGLILLSSFLAIGLLIEKGRKRELANRILQENEQRYKDLAEAGANVFWELDEQLRYSYVSGGIEDLCGFRPADMKGCYPPDLHRNNSRLDVDWALFERITQSRQSFKNFTFSLQDQHKGIRIFRINGNPLFDEQHRFLGYRGVKQEITAEQNLYKKIAYQASYDDLTGLINRREFNEKLNSSLEKAQKYHTESVLCYLDLDRFKIVNDTAGHLVGDRLLSELAQLLQSLIRKEDTLGRLGGDEFGLLLEGCSTEEAEQVCEQLIAAINNYRLQWKTVEFDVGVSIGMVGIQRNSTDAAELLSRADLACYQAKNLGRGRVYFFEHDDLDLNLQQTQMSHVANISQAIKENRFYLVKQLIKPMIKHNHEQQHYELLLRLKDRNGNLIAPDDFIPVAERYGVITIVDRWVLEAALNCYEKYFASQQALVSINLSGASINDERFTSYALELIQRSQVPGNCLCFEITETAAITQINHAQKFIMAMKTLGVKFALDDFGSGLSSFSYLKNLPVDYLKIDGNLVKAIPNEEFDRAIVNSINEVAHLMGIKTIAEFVENEQILEQIGKISVDYVQGYVTGEPVAIF